MDDLINYKIIEGNIIVEDYNDVIRTLYNEKIQEIRQNYKVIDVDWLDRTLVHSSMFADKYFVKTPEKKVIIHNMLDYYLNHEDKPIYKKLDYLCNAKEKICICNTHAEDFRKIYDGVNYKQGNKYISWCKKNKENY